MNPPIFFHICRIVMAATLLPALAPAQTPHKSSAPAAEAPVRIDIDIHGKDEKHVPSLKEAVDLVVARFREAGESANVIFKDDDGIHPIPSLKLQKVTFAQAMKALELVVSEYGLVFQGDSNLIVIEPDRERDHEYERRGRYGMHVFNVSDYLHHGARAGDGAGNDVQLDRLQTLLGAIAKGIEISKNYGSDVSDPNIEWDDRSGLLFVSSKPESLKIVAEIVAALCYPRDAPTPQAKP